MTSELLTANQLMKRFGGIKAVGGENGLSLSVGQGNCVGIIGPNGAGKSTIFNLLSGVLKPDAGRVMFDGIDLSHVPTSKVAWLGLARTFQTPRVFPSLSVLDNVLVGVDNRREFLLKALVSGGRYMDGNPTTTRAREVLTQVGLDDALYNDVGTLSGGQLRMLEIARQLLRQPRILLLDEPTAGVDPALQDKLRTLLQQLMQSNVTLIVVEHNLGFLMDLADSITVVVHGEVLAEGAPEVVRSDERVVSAYLGDEQSET